MNTDLKYEKANIELRRGEVLKLLAKGHSQNDIAKSLNVSAALISLDVQYLKEQAQRELRVHIKEVIPFEYARAVSGINGILRKATDILDKTDDPKLQYQFMTLLMQCYGQIMSLATDGGIVQEVMKKVESLSNRGSSKSEEECEGNSSPTLEEEQPKPSKLESFEEEETEEDLEKEEE